MAGSFFSNIDAKFYIAVDDTDSDVPDPQNSDLNATQFGALDWEEIPEVINGPDTGGDQNMLAQSVWGRQLDEPVKGSVVGASSELRLAIPDGAQSDGRKALGAAAAFNDNNAFAYKYEWPNGRIEYGRIKFGTPRFPKGGKEDFPEEVFPTQVAQLPVFSQATP